MPPNEDNLSAQERLALIDSMIQKAKNRFSENGTLYLLWGWVVLFCCTFHYTMLRITHQQNWGYVWSITIIAGIYQIIYLSKQKKSATVRTYTDEIINAVWVCFGFVMGIATFIMAKLGNWSLMYSLVLLIYGIPTFLSGMIMRFKPLMIGGICCWILSMLSVYVQTVEILLFLAPAVLAAWIIPGYLLRAKYKSEHHG
jgi:hypothetical protein